MTTWYSYFRNFSPIPFSQTAGLSGGYNINEILNPTDDAGMKDDKNLNTLALIERAMLGYGALPDRLYPDILRLYGEYLSNQISTTTGDERIYMINNWQRYNSNREIAQYPQYTALAVAMLYIADGWRILGGKINARKYRRFIRRYLRHLPANNPIKIAYTAVAKIMHNPENAGDNVLTRLRKSREENESEGMWGNVYAPRLYRIGIPKMRESKFYSLDEAAANPALAGKERPTVKKEIKDED